MTIPSALEIFFPIRSNVPLHQKNGFSSMYLPGIMFNLTVKAWFVGFSTWWVSDAIPRKAVVLRIWYKIALKSSLGHLELGAPGVKPFPCPRIRLLVQGHGPLCPLATAGRAGHEPQPLWLRQFLFFLTYPSVCPTGSSHLLPPAFWSLLVFPSWDVWGLQEEAGIWVFALSRLNF